MPSDSVRESLANMTRQSIVHSVQSNYSTHSREHLQQEVESDINMVHSLIVEEEWFNIPAPVRNTCEGIILFAEKLARRIVDNAENAHRKILIMDEKVRKSETVTKQQITRLDTMIQRDIKKVNQMIDNQNREHQQKMTELGYQNQMMREKLETTEEFLMKMRERVETHTTHVNKKIEIVDELQVGFMQVEKDSKYCIEQLTVPGIIGPDKKENNYTSVREWIENAHEFNE